MNNYINILIATFISKYRLLRDNQDGIGSIEMVLILLVLVGLIVVFRENILSLIDTIFDKITNQIDSF